MWDALKRACKDTLALFGVSRRSWARLATWSAITVGPIVLVYLFRGRDEAMIDTWDAIYGLAIGVGILVLVFVSQMWFAPYRILQDKLDQLKDAIGHNEENRSPQTVDTSHWKNIVAFKLGDAACLWVGIEPHQPIRHGAAKAKFAELSAAVMHLDIDSSHLADISLRITPGEELPWPGYDFYVMADALRKYAKPTGGVPDFLEAGHDNSKSF